MLNTQSVIHTSNDHRMSPLYTQLSPLSDHTRPGIPNREDTTYEGEAAIVRAGTTLLKVSNRVDGIRMNDHRRSGVEIVVGIVPM